ncbi:HK97-gp10 family putative phage morphogenesis protein [Sphingomonas sp.]|uniref:HK97-gp10 family putative phage morphogenesis protein n=1 Tax=Sphingomonas sp. TaxID=28214 RepID=UPI0025D64E6B|nr:HK97-gp10 family putative phage morphogenesis protein [Sphingomonas sp.]MBV9528324.1 HK97 gp10 family phage protein [Sphingomonas sp.]
MAKITGQDRVTARLSRLASEATVRKVGAALFAGGQLIEAEAKHLITEGAVSGKHHIASKPGEPPSNDTGTLVSHIETTQPEPLKVEVSSNAPYAAVLEFGGSKMAERPHMRPATDRKRQEVVELVRNAVNEAIGGR